MKLSEEKRITIMYRRNRKKGLRIYEYSYGLDMGCASSRKLTALVVDESGKTEIVHVKYKNERDIMTRDSIVGMTHQLGAWGYCHEHSYSHCRSWESTRAQVDPSRGSVTGMFCVRASIIIVQKVEGIRLVVV
ncbi:hypothetical protein J1614_010826 [Plenodomus biglobosus]|nr:hypothetical protein J1614_010826 [Plenodomus biglobosus]